LQIGLTRGNTYLSPVLQAIAANQIEVIDLSSAEKSLMSGMPAKLNAGESEAIAFSQTRRATLLSNDKRAIRYCERQSIKVLNLADILRLLWIKRVITQKEVKSLIAKMKAVEGLTLSRAALNTIFAPRRRRRHRRKP
jgi:predicted nucleic acid-binding protein